MDRSRWAHTNSHYRPTRHSPYGDPGPGLVGRVARMHGRQCVFEWHRERSWQSKYRNRMWGDPTGPIKTTIAVPGAKLLNIDAYKPGDFKQFYNDPRTRADYLKWAPLLLTAEDYHAGKRKVQEPGYGKDED